MIAVGARSLLLFFVIAAAAALPAQAQRASSETLEGPARKHYIAGAGLLQALRYDDAIVEFKKGYAIGSDPLFIYLEASARWAKGDDDAAALQLYKRYRKEAPDAANAYEVDQRIKTLEGGRHIESIKSQPSLEAPRTRAPDNFDNLAKQFQDDAVAPAPNAPPSAPPPAQGDPAGLFKEPPPPPPPPAPTPPSRPITRRWWFWALTGLAIAGGVGAGTYALAK